MKYLIVFALVAAVSADVSHLRQYLPPVAPQAFDAPAPAFPTKEYLPPVQHSAPAHTFHQAPAPAFHSAPAPTYQHQPSFQQFQQFQQPAAASFNQQDGYNYRNPTQF